MKKGSVFFIVSCARSGSTSLTNILNEATNCECCLEPSPNLNVETRLMMDGKLDNPIDVIDKTIAPRIESKLLNNDVYGEKNVTYGPFISYLYERFKCKFIFIKRDGRDVVRSLINWHDKKFGNIYRECAEMGNILPQALANAAQLPAHLDTSDYSRPRPGKDDPLYYEWENLTRAEMCAYYWAKINNIYVDQLKMLPEDAWISVDYTSPQANSLVELADFCGLLGLKKEKIQSMLDRKINSLRDRGTIIERESEYPEWMNWDSVLRNKFDRIAGKTMYKLGYYGIPQTNWKPLNYGVWWINHKGGHEWYSWMYRCREKMHIDMIDWVAEREAEGEVMESIADIGCGLGVGYAEAFSEKRYIGIDMSINNIEWCRKNILNKKHEYYCLDFIETPLQNKYDLVFSSGTIDNTYDIDSFLVAMVKSSKRWIYATLYRGWFPDLNVHQYKWSDEHACFYNNASPRRIREKLLSIGCKNITIEPIMIKPNADNHAPPFYETRIIAMVPD